MSLLNELNSQVNRLGFVDVKLLTVSAFFGGLVVAKLAPELLGLSAWWFVLLAVACAFHPFVLLLDPRQQGNDT